MTHTRRQFLRVVEGVAAAVALPAVLSGCRTADAPSEVDPFPPKPSRAGGPESWVVSTCGACPGGCGVRARVAKGRLIGMTGNPLHPVNRGGLCPLGQSAAHTLYHPDRLTGPMRRVGAAGSGEFRPVPWNEAISEVATRLRDVRARGLAHTVAIVDGTRGLSSELASRFLSSFGSPNHLSGRTWNDTRATEAMAALQGVSGPAAYDLENARFILAFGSGWLEGSSSPVGAARAYAHARRGRGKGARVRVVQIEPRLSVGAAHADEWIPVPVGSEGVLALGLIHMILREGLENREFIDSWSSGFDWLQSIVLRDYHPAAVQEATGVDVATLIRLARQFALSNHAVAIGDDRTGPGAHRPETRMAIHALNALVGAVNAPGGTLTPMPVPMDPLPKFTSDEIAKTSLAMPSITAGSPSPGVTDLQAWLEGSASYPVNVLLAYGSDPLAALGGGDRARDALARIPFIVSFSSFLDDTAQRADFVLPDHTWLERWQDDPTFTSRGFSLLGIRRPIIPPRLDTRHASETLCEIARQIGGPPKEAMPFTDFSEVMKLGLKGVHRSGRGAVFDVTDAEPWVETMESSGWRAADFGTFDDFWKSLSERGGWWDPIYDFGARGRVLRTQSGKFEFERVAKLYDPRSPVDPQVVRITDGVRPPPPSFPLRLHLYPLLAAFGDNSGPLPFVQDLLGREMEQSWSLWVELSPEDARKIGVSDGAAVHVESAEGAVTARVKVYPGIRPGVAAMPLGPGGARGLKCKRGMSAQAASLVSLGRGRTAGATTWTDGWVGIRKA